MLTTSYTFEGSEHGTEGGFPIKEVRQEHVKLPSVFRQTALAPQIPGVVRHSSISKQRVPAAVNSGRQRHSPSLQTALLVQSKLDLQSVRTSVASQATFPFPLNPGGHLQTKPGFVFLHTALDPHGLFWAEHSSVSEQMVKGSPVRPCLQVHW